MINGLSINVVCFFTSFGLFWEPLLCLSDRGNGCLPARSGLPDNCFRYGASRKLMISIKEQHLIEGNINYTKSTGTEKYTGGRTTTVHPRYIFTIIGETDLHIDNMLINLKKYLKLITC